MSRLKAAMTNDAAPASAEAKGECWGVNACKGQGWLSLSKSECDEKNGKFKAG